jgi:hypothetical protein
VGDGIGDVVGVNVGAGVGAAVGSTTTVDAATVTDWAPAAAMIEAWFSSSFRSNSSAIVSATVAFSTSCTMSSSAATLGGPASSHVAFSNFVSYVASEAVSNVPLLTASAAASASAASLLFPTACTETASAARRLSPALVSKSASCPQGVTVTATWSQGRRNTLQKKRKASSAVIVQSPICASTLIVKWSETSAVAPRSSASVVTIWSKPWALATTSAILVLTDAGADVAFVGAEVGDGVGDGVGTAGRVHSSKV